MTLRESSQISQARRGPAADSTTVQTALRATPPAIGLGFFLRAILVAAGVVFLSASLTHVHDGVILQRDIGLQDYSAPAALAILFIVVLLNVLLARILPRVSLSVAELALAACLIFAAVPVHRFLAQPWVSTVGLLPAMVDAKAPAYANLQKANPFSQLPPEAQLTLEQSRQFEATLPSTGATPLSPRQVPWSVWAGPARFWAPLLLSYIALSISLAYLLHRQWAINELVQYPLAEYIAMLLRREPGQSLPAVVHRGLFWAGLLLPMAIFGALGLQTHVDRMIVLPVKFNYMELVSQFPFLNYSLEGYSLLRGTLYLSIIAVAFLLPREISFTAWATWPVMIVASYVWYTQTGRRFTGQEASMFVNGAWWGMAGLLLLAGRWHYWTLLKAALGVTRDRTTAGVDVWLARVFMLSLALLAWCLVRLGLSLDLALLWTLSLCVMLLVLSRLVAEMGLPWVPVMFAGPMNLLLTGLGESALGSKAVAASALAGNALLPQSVTSLPLAPAIGNAVHIESTVTGRVRSLRVIAPFLIIALLLSAGLVIWLGYQVEGPANDPPRLPAINNAAQIAARLGGFDATQPTIAQRWSNLAPIAGFGPLFSAGLMLVIAVGLLRLRLPRLPIHPLPLVLLGSWIMSRLWWAFLVGWVLKTAILKIGGVPLLEKSRPFFAGILAGLALILGLWMIVHVILFWSQGMVFDPAWSAFLPDMYPS